MGSDLRTRESALELGLAHLRAATDVEPARLRLQFLARRLVTLAHCVGLLAQRGTRRLVQVLERLLALGARLRLLDVLAGGLSLLGGCHRQRVPETALRQPAPV